MFESNFMEVLMKKILIVLLVLLICPMLNAQATGYDYIPDNIQGFVGFHVQQIHTSEIFQFFKKNTPIGINVKKMEAFLLGTLQLSLTEDFDTIILAGSPGTDPFGIVKMFKDISYMKTFFAGNEIEVKGKTVYRDKTNKDTVFYFVSNNLLIVGKLDQVSAVIDTEKKQSGFIKKYGFQNFVSASIKNSSAIISAMQINENLTKLVNKKKDIGLKMILNKMDGIAASLNIKDSLIINLGLIFKTEQLATSINDLCLGICGTISDVVDIKLEPKSFIFKWFSDRIKNKHAKKTVLLHLEATLKEIQELMKKMSSL